MRLVVYGDCIPIDPVNLDEGKRFPGLISSAFGDLSVEVLAYSGETTLESKNNINELLDKKPDFVILNWGLNDALPRGLKRINRSRAIRTLYKLRMGKTLRWISRTFLLNPLECLLQFIRKPRFYYSVEETCGHFKYLFEAIRKKNRETVIITVSITPIANYRFRHANKYIKLYNDAIRQLCEKEGSEFIDIYSIFIARGLKVTLGTDKFHFSARGHSIAAEEIKKVLDKYTRL
jgi:lysophospholipase L1-like esterase